MRLNLGHSVGDRQAPGGDALRFAAEIAAGSTTLCPREPLERDVVDNAERCLGIDERPVYAYVGCIHPSLGDVGLVFAHEWADTSLQGATKCDSGGLAGGLGAFQFVDENQRPDALKALSFVPESSPGWLDSFSQEVRASYQSALDYVGGSWPQHAGWNDVRSDALSRVEAHPDATLDPRLHDRRVWTWELRLRQGPEAHHLRCVVFNHRMTDRYVEYTEFQDTELFPKNMPVITSRAGPDGGDDHSDFATVHDLLLDGGAP